MIVTAAECCPALTKLDVGRTEGMSDVGVLKLVEACTSLRHLNISWCDGVTINSLIAILATLPELSWLSLEVCFACRLVWHATNWLYNHLTALSDRAARVSVIPQNL